MAITDLMVKLEAKVKDAQEKGSALDKATAAVNKAQTDYSNALAEVDKLKSELVATIGDIFPSGRIRVA